MDMKLLNRLQMIDTISGFHIEPTNICTLKCPACPRTRFINHWPKKWHNHSLDVDEVLNFLDVDLRGKAVNLCGAYGDPIYHNDFINFVEQFKKRGAELTIVTNGSYKTKEWWSELVKKLDHNDVIHFSVDGIPENFTQYRVNGHWPSIQQAMEVCAAAPVQTLWKYIPFSYNQNDIDAARALSQELGIDQFGLQLSDRFDESTEHLKPSPDLIGSRYYVKENWKKNTSVNSKFTPSCGKGNQHYITADGFYSPCCFLSDYRFYYKTQFGKNKKEYDIKNITLSQLLEQANVIKFYQTLDQQPGCQFNCTEQLS